VASDRPFVPDWRDPRGYAGLLSAEPAAIAWEWLRRDPGYRAAATTSARRAANTAPAVLPTDASAARWGLHAFADPALPASAARPVWHRAAHARVLVAEARPGGTPEDRFDLRRFATAATVVREPAGPEHLLVSDGAASLRLDIVSGSLLAGPVRLSYRLAGLATLRGPLDTLGALLRLSQSGRLARPRARDRNRRFVLLLRAWDALEAEASQREVAAVLLSDDAAAARWRSEAPSLRSRAQRLVRGARAMAGGGYRRLLEA
jgi:hypothetical protein